VLGTPSNPEHPRDTADDHDEGQPRKQIRAGVSEQEIYEEQRKTQPQQHSGEAILRSEAWKGPL
jgi:hypothetical protein